MIFQLESSVKHIMTSELYLLNIQDPISLVRDIFKKTKLRHLPVVTNHKVVGMVDVNDLQLLKLNSSSSLVKVSESEITVVDFMHNNPTCVHEDERISDVALKFTQAEHHALPVINQDGIVGIITTTDIINVLMKFLNGSKSQKELNRSPSNK